LTGDVHLLFQVAGLDDGGLCNLLKQLLYWVDRVVNEAFAGIRVIFCNSRPTVLVKLAGNSWSTPSRITACHSRVAIFSGKEQEIWAWYFSWYW